MLWRTFHIWGKEMRGFLGIIAGLAGVALAMMLVSLVGSQLVSEVPPVNAGSADAIKATYDALGTDTRLLILVSWFLGALAGSAVAKKIVGRSWGPWTVAGLMEIYLLLTVLVLPMPLWMKLGAVAAPLLAGYLADRLFRGPSGHVPDETTEVRGDGEI